MFAVLIGVGLAFAPSLEAPPHLSESVSPADTVRTP